jgi:hypothetical protein
MTDLNESVASAREVATAAIDSASRTVGSWSHSTDINVGGTERLLSIAGGVLLFGWGIYRRGLVGYAAITTAAALWDRGVRGHCALYSALGKTSIDGMDTANSANSSPALP